MRGVEIVLEECGVTVELAGQLRYTIACYGRHTVGLVMSFR